jgi:hypothetical protein
MNDNAFQLFLRRQDKKAHVVAGLVEQVRRFELYLVETGRGELNNERDYKTNYISFCPGGLLAAGADRLPADIANARTDNGR